MGYVGKLALKEKAQELRKQGYSYKEILQEMTVSKDTLSKWCRDIVLTEQQKQRLISNKKLGQRKGSIVAAENKRRKRLETIEFIHKKALLDVKRITSREEFLLGIALYAAEGTKADKHGGFSNADPNLVTFMTRWFINHAKVPTSKFRGRIWLHNNLSEPEAKAFWSNITGIPMDQFIKSYIVNRGASSVRKNIHKYGVFTISFSDAEIHRRIMGWISGVFDVKITTRSAIAQR